MKEVGDDAETFFEGRVTLWSGDCLSVLSCLPDCSVDSCVTDPPYHLTSIVKRFGAENAAPVKAYETAPYGGNFPHQASGGGTGAAFARMSKGFMGKQWDGGDIAFRPEVWAQVFRVLKPGGYLLAFGGTRTYHRMACAIEDAGFDVRDMVSWLYGSGFPKSHDVSKAITKRADPAKLLEIKLWLAAQFERSGKSKSQINRECGFTASDYLKTEPGNDAAGRATWHFLLPYGPKWAKLKDALGFDGSYDAEIEQFGIIAEQRLQAKANKDIYGKFSGVVTDYELTDAAREWAGWGTALKPALEPICMARKPLIGTVAANVLVHGTGAINIDGCRVASAADDDALRIRNATTSFGLLHDGREKKGGVPLGTGGAAGRWPANVITDGSEEVIGAFPDTGVSSGGKGEASQKTALAGDVYGKYSGATLGQNAGGLGDSGSAARFFYSAKADSFDRIGSKHPTVKPVDLMQYLVRLVTPKGGTVLDPFSGTGTTGEAAWREGMRAVLIEREAEYQADIRRRMALCLAGPDERARAAAKALQRDRPVDAGPLFLQIRPPVAPSTQNEPAGSPPNLEDIPDFLLRKPYNGHADFAASYSHCLAAVRERVANGGEPWVPKK